MSDYTKLLCDFGNGKEMNDTQFADVYAELRRLAKIHMRRENRNQTLQTTGLAHETFLRLANRQRKTWNSRQHFAAYVSEVMRCILVDRARKKATEKRGGNLLRNDLDCDNVAPVRSTEVLAIDEALEALAFVDEKAAEIIKLRYFVGLSIKEAAESMDVSVRTANRLWAFARAWLRKQIAAGE